MQVPGLEFQCLTSRYNVIESNFYTAHKVAENGFNVIDLHYHALPQSYRRNRDGIHWSPEANRGFTNLILTNLCVIMNQPLPNRVPENISLEKIKLRVKAIEATDDLDGKSVQKKLSDLASNAKKLSQKQLQILSELKSIEVPKPKTQNRMHPYNNGPPPPRVKGQNQQRSWDQVQDPKVIETFGSFGNQGPGSNSCPPWTSRNSEHRIWGSAFKAQDRWQADPDFWDPGSQGLPPRPSLQQQRSFPSDPWISGSANWGPRPNQQPGPNFANRDFMEPPWDQAGPRNEDGGKRWKSAPSSRGPFSDPPSANNQAWQGPRPDWDQAQDLNQWRPNLDLEQDLDPIPTSSARSRLNPPLEDSKLFSRQRSLTPPMRPDVGRRLNYAPTDAHFINPMFRHMVPGPNDGASFNGSNISSSRSFADDQDDFSFEQRGGIPALDSIRPIPSFNGGNFYDNDFRFGMPQSGESARLQFGGPQTQNFSGGKQF